MIIDGKELRSRQLSALLENRILMVFFSLQARIITVANVRYKHNELGRGTFLLEENFKGFITTTTSPGHALI